MAASDDYFGLYTRNQVVPIERLAMDARTRIDFDELMRVLSFTGFVALATWVLSAAVGVLSGYTLISPSATLRFLLAVLIVSFARRTYWEVCEWRWSKLPPDERSGFFSPLGEQAWPFCAGTEGQGTESQGTEDQAIESQGFATATGSSQARA
jgi:hypothetical protein